VTTVQSGGRSLLAAVDDAAAQNGLVPGMGLADARAIAPDLIAVPADPEREARALNTLADWCDRYTPSVALSGPDGLYLDITGCAHLAGPAERGERALLADLLRRVRCAGFAAQAALTDTPGAAWALARFSEATPENGILIPPGEAETALLKLPAAALRLPPGIAEDLSRVGLRRIGDLRRFEQGGGRGPLAIRYSDAAWRQLDLALGRAEEPISPRRPLPTYRERLAFAEPIATPEDIARATRRLLAKLCVRFVATGVGARRLELAFYRSDGTISGIAIGTAKPSRDSAHLFHLLRQKLDRIEPGFGIDLAVIAAPEVDALAALQIDLPQQQGNHQSDCVAVSRAAMSMTGGDDGDLAELVDRLGNRLGPDQVWRAAPRETYIPERAAERVRPLSPPAPKQWRLPPRPVRLFARPEPIDAIAGVGAGLGTAPSLFRWRAHLHRVRRAEGPERLSPEWWRRDSDQATRDYWRVEDEAGRRFWLFQKTDDRGQRTEGPVWFIHGEFA
jgi:protein ImuB